jgi:hypothetical protein
VISFLSDLNLQVISKILPDGSLLTLHPDVATQTVYSQGESFKMCRKDFPRFKREARGGPQLEKTRTLDAFDKVCFRMHA